MLISVEATYESGVLKLRQPLPLDEHETVQVTVRTGKPGPTDSIIPRNDSARIEPLATAPAGGSSLLADEPTDSPEWDMLDIFLNVPPSPTTRTVIARRGRLPLPDPPNIPSDDGDIE
jgi:predicted DNA-binding antitoxin AbrB/MazE fold protein